MRLKRLARNLAIGWREGGDFLEEVRVSTRLADQADKKALESYQVSRGLVAKASQIAERASSTQERNTNRWAPSGRKLAFKLRTRG